MIAVCLLTCDRLEYTSRTLFSFAQMNDRARFQLLHADDASTDPRVPSLAKAFGFDTVASGSKRRGWRHMRRLLFHAAAKRGAEWVLFLENDIEWARPFPWELFAFIASRPQFYCLRLFGAFKDRARLDACLPFHKSDRRKPVKWKMLKQAPEPAQAGWIHWSAQPSVTRIRPLLELHEYGMESPDLTARVVENVTYHVGAVRTRELAPC